MFLPHLLVQDSLSHSWHPPPSTLLHFWNGQCNVIYIVILEIIQCCLRYFLKVMKINKYTSSPQRWRMGGRNPLDLNLRSLGLRLSSLRNTQFCSYWEYWCSIETHTKPNILIICNCIPCTIIIHSLSSPNNQHNTSHTGT